MTGVRSTSPHRDHHPLLAGSVEHTVQACDEGIRFLLVSGKPIEVSVAWYGPIVMNIQEELRQAMSELQSGKFIKHR
jgi:quercetin 2,3-dioxygenase